MTPCPLAPAARAAAWMPPVRRRLSAARPALAWAALLAATLLLAPGPVRAQAAAPAPAASQTPAAQPPPGKELIAVLDLKPVGATAVEASAVTDRLREELLKSGRFTLVDRSQIQAVLNEQALQQSGCTEQECAVQVGRILGVHKIVAGKVTMISPTAWQVSTIVVDVETAQTVDAESIRYRGDFFGLLSNEVPPLAAKLARQAPGPHPSAAAPPEPAPQPEATPSPKPAEPQEAAPKRIWRVYGTPLTTHGVTVDTTRSGTTDTTKLESNGVDLAAHLELANHWGAQVELSGGTLKKDPNHPSITDGSMSGGLLGVDYTWHVRRWSFMAGGGVFSSAVSYTSTASGTSEHLKFSFSGLAITGGVDFAVRYGLLLGAHLVAGSSSKATGNAVDAAHSAGVDSRRFSASRISLLVGYQF